MKLRHLLFALMTMTVFTMTAQSSSDYEKFRTYFEDAICSVLKPEYAEMDDEQLTDEMNGIPQVLVNIALKVKNEAWEKHEKEFRIAKFKPHSDPKKWEKYLDVYTYCLMPEPTGIIGNGGQIYIFVGDELPDSINIGVYMVADDMGHGFMYNYLEKGLNVVSMPKEDDGRAKMLFVEYYVNTDTTANSKKLADYPEISLHIEGGYAKGYFDVTKHDDAFWRELNERHKTSSESQSYPGIEVKGEKVLFRMDHNRVAAICPNTITDAIGWWDQCVKWQHELMGVDKFYDRWNDLIMAKDGDGVNMSALQGYTFYPYHTLADILPWSSVSNNPGQMWGPAHEIGHVNQGIINMVSCTEVSNNLFANAQLFRAGTSTSRGKDVSVCVKDYMNKVPYPQRNDVFSKTRMYFQLYLYFHAAGKDVTFYPRLFDALREDRLIQGYEMSAVDDQLKFAEACCEVAQMDLSEFFEAWGFFFPMDNAYIGDYSNYYVTLTTEEAEASRKKMQQYEKKGGHLMFIEDRIKPSPRTDGKEGYRIDYEEAAAIGKMGNVGQWGDYIDESVKATGYYFYNRLDFIEIIKSDDANGALGFKLLDANTGELISFSNTYNIQIPAHAYGSEFKVVAAQADGTDAVLSDIIDSDDENIKKVILEKIIEDISAILKYTTKDGSDIGYYYTDAVAELKELHKKAKEAIKNDDTSEHSYSEWFDILNQELEKVKNNPEARATMKPNEIYNIVNTVHFPYYLNDGEMGLQVISGNGSQDGQKWLIESMGENNSFVIKNINGEYINDIEMNVGAMCNGKSAEEAIVFNATYTTDGDVYFTTADEESAYLAVNGDGNVIGSKELVNSALWIVVRIGKVVTSIENIEADKRDNVIYDMLGRKVKAPLKGIYIMNGEKVMVK